MKLFINILLIILIFTTSCNHSYSVGNANKIDTITHKKVLQQKQIVTIASKDSLDNIHLKYGFKIVTGYIKINQKYPYPFFQLWHYNTKLLTDTINEYLFDEKQYPILNKLNNGVDELLLKYNDNPNKDKLIVLRIQNNKILKTDTIPTFDGKPEKINGLLVYSGCWDNGEEWDENGKRYTSFDPEIYYKFTPNGIKLDSSLTISRNEKVYGNVNPFDNKYEIGFPIDEKGKIDTTYKNVLRKKIEPMPKKYFKD